LLCWLVVVPVLEVRAAVSEYVNGNLNPEEAVERLGGQEQAGAKLATYMRLPGWLAPHKHDKNVPSLPGHCGRAGAPALILLLDDSDTEVLEQTLYWLCYMEQVPMEARGKLEKLTNHDDERVRQAAAEALRKIKAAGEKKDQATLKKMMETVTPREREIAAAELRVLRAVKSHELSKDYRKAIRTIEEHPDYKKYGKEMRDANEKLRELKARLGSEK
jgi:hypothetical protein